VYASLSNVNPRKQVVTGSHLPVLEKRSRKVPAPHGPVVVVVMVDEEDVEFV
jgi:hypothetical protein